MQDFGSLVVFKVTAREQGHYKGPSGASVTYCNISCLVLGWSVGAKMLGKLPVLGRPTNMDNSRTRPVALAVGADGGCLDIFSLVYLFSFPSPSLGDGPI